MGHVRRRPGRGGIYGSWRHADGQSRETLLPGVTTLAEARRQVARAELAAWQQAQGIADPTTADVEISQLTTAWLAAIQIRCRPRTRRDYTDGVNAVLDWLARDALANGRRPPTRASGLRLPDVRRFAAARLQAVGPRTVQKVVGALKQMLAWACDQRPAMLGINPLAAWKPLRGPKRRQRRALTRFEIARLLLVLDREAEAAADNLADARRQHKAATTPPAIAKAERHLRGSDRRLHLAITLRDAVRLFLGTGIRPGELIALQWPDVDFDRRELRIREETRKRGKTLILPLRDDLAAMLQRRRLDHRGPHVFTNSAGKGWDATTGNLLKRLRPHLTAAGLGPDVDLHTLRHTVGSHLIAAGVSPKTVQDILGHAHLSTTVDIYAHEIESQARRSALELSPLGRAKPPASDRPSTATGSTA